MKKNFFSQKPVYKYLYGFIHNHPQMETIPLSYNWINYGTFITTRILTSNNKEHATDTSHNMDESQKYSEWKKPDSKCHVLYNSISKNTKS